MGVVAPRLISPAFTQVGESPQRMGACAFIPAAQIPELANLPVNLAHGATLTTSPIRVAGFSLFSVLVNAGFSCQVGFNHVNPSTLVEYTAGGFLSAAQPAGPTFFSGWGYSILASNGVFHTIVLKIKNADAIGIASLNTFPGLWLMTR